MARDSLSFNFLSDRYEVHTAEIFLIEDIADAVSVDVATWSKGKHTTARFELEMGEDWNGRPEATIAFDGPAESLMRLFENFIVAVYQEATGSLDIPEGVTLQDMVHHFDSPDPGPDPDPTLN